jgi:pSer/pThr/pTyr-binding forkhead associated (FHA) protein
MTHELSPRTIIGRAADADIQVLDPLVSRQHAKIVCRPDGTVALVDLGSSNGTVVDEIDVDRVRLRPGNVISVLGTRFVYETQAEESEEIELEEDGDVSSGPHVLSGKSLRRTGPRAPLNAAQREMAGAKTKIGPVGARENDVVSVNRDDALVLLDDVLDYRELRVKQLRGDELSPLEESRLERLVRKLYRRDDERESSRRRFQRFSCQLDAEIGRHEGPKLETSRAPVTDLGAGGAQVVIPSTALELGEVVWLSVDVSELYETTPRLVFKSRVAWKQDDGARAGLVFAGHASYAKDAVALMNASKKRRSWVGGPLRVD